MVDALRLCATRMEECEGGWRQTQSSPGEAHGDTEAAAWGWAIRQQEEGSEGPTVRGTHTSFTSHSAAQDQVRRVTDLSTYTCFFPSEGCGDTWWHWRPPGLHLVGLRRHQGEEIKSRILCTPGTCSSLYAILEPSLAFGCPFLWGATRLNKAKGSESQRSNDQVFRRQPCCPKDAH